MDNLIINDGFIYCIDTKLTKSGCNQKIIKIGKTQYKNCSKQSVIEDKLLHRYSTYYSNCSLLFCQRVSNHHLAEKYILKELQKLNISNELFYYDKIVEYEFLILTLKFPNLEDVLSEKTIDELNILNKIRRNSVNHM